MSDNKVLVSRDSLEALANYQSGSTTIGEFSAWASDILMRHDTRAQPSDGALTNEGAEPVALLNTLERFESDGEDFVRWHDVRDVFAMIVRPQAPASVVLPERKHVPDFTKHPMLNKEYSGWNACLDRVKDLNDAK